jgi:hypothetical protein
VTLEELLNTIALSDVDDWNVMTCWGADAGPSFLYDLDVWTSGDDKQGLAVREHGLRASYKRDVSIGLACGLPFMPLGNGSGQDLRFDWVRSFDEPITHGEWLDLFWNGALIDRHLVLLVDGGQAMLPNPRASLVESRQMTQERFADTVSARAVAIARLVHCFEHRPDDFDRYLEMAGFVVALD